MSLYKSDLTYHSFMKQYEKTIGQFDTSNMGLAFYENDGLYFYCKDNGIIDKLKADNVKLVPTSKKKKSSVKKFIKGAGNINLIQSTKPQPKSKERDIIKNISHLGENLKEWILG